MVIICSKVFSAFVNKKLTSVIRTSFINDILLHIMIILYTDLGALYITDDNLSRNGHTNLICS